MSSHPHLFAPTSAEDFGERWSTPQWLYDQLNAEFEFTLDPCCTAASAKCAKFYTPAEDGLAQTWAGERVYMNPPYGKATGRWLKKAVHEIQSGALVVVALLPAWTDRAWFHDYVLPFGEVRWLRGRLLYGTGRRSLANGQPSWGSMVVVYSPRVDQPGRYAAGS